MKVVELLPFFNETDILEARLRLMALVVDRHYIAEGDLTHQGEPKPLYLDGFDWPDVIRPDNIRRCKVVLPEHSSEATSADELNWLRERLQRNALAHYVTDPDGDLAPDDLVLSCDLDEIVAPYAVGRIAQATLNGPVALGMRMIYYGRREDPRGWGAAKAFRVKDAPESLSELRLRGGLPLVPLVGWHLSYIGDAARRRAKVEAFAHAENRPGTSAWERIAEAREGPNGEALVDFDPDELPATLRQLVDDAS